MKLLPSALVLFIFTYSLAYALDDLSFKNTDRYDMLKLKPIAKKKDFTVVATLIPPAGKKLNHASYIKIWEKKKNEWNELDEIIPGDEMRMQTQYVLTKKMHTDTLDTSLAMEVEFIHCNSRGGQCAMERYLGKIERTQSTKNSDLKVRLKIK